MKNICYSIKVHDFPVYGKTPKESQSELDYKIECIKSILRRFKYSFSDFSYEITKFVKPEYDSNGDLKIRQEHRFNLKFFCRFDSVPQDYIERIKEEIDLYLMKYFGIYIYIHYGEEI